MTEISSYQFNHPKNYIGYVLAFKQGGSRDEADRITEDYVTGGPDMARRGAQNMGLIAHERDGRQHVYSLTERGQWFAEEAPERFGCKDIQAVLETFDELRGARKRFVEEFPGFAEIAPDVIQGDPAVGMLVDYLEDYHVEKTLTFDEYGVTLVELFRQIKARDEQFAVDLLIRDDEAIRENYTESDLERGTLSDGTAIYRSPTTYQLKNLLWHMGVVQTKGTQAQNVDPEAETWALEKMMIDRVPEFSCATDGGQLHG